MSKNPRFNIPLAQAICLTLLSLVIIWRRPLDDQMALFHHHTATIVIAPHDVTALVILLAVFLIGLAFFLVRRKRLAYIATLALLALLTLILVSKPTLILLTIANITLIVWLLLTRAHYTARSSPIYARAGSAITLLLIVAALVISTLQLHSAAPAAGFREAFHTSFDIFIANPVSSTPRLHHAIIAATHLIRVFQLAALVTLLFSLFQPSRLTLTDDQATRETVHNLIDRYGTSSEDYLKLFPHDKYYAVSKDDTAAIAYGLSGGSLVILGGAIGADGSRQAFSREFIRSREAAGWRVAAIAINAAELAEYREIGLHNYATVGSEAVVDCTTFVNDTLHSKHFRYAFNRAERQGLSFALWPHPTETQIDQLAAISKAWVGAGQRRDYRFFMAPFERDYIAACTIGVVLRDDQPIAYVNLLPVGHHVQVSSIDHMRALLSADAVTMHYLIAQTIIHEQAAGKTAFNLGLSPLHSTSDTRASNLLLYGKRIASHFYAFDGISQFKSKFRPSWQPQYIAYHGTRADLLTIINDVLLLSSVNTKLRLRIYVFTTLLLTLAALIYIALP